jgi:predicted helicase
MYDCFSFASSGIETTRDHLAYGFSSADLRSRFNAFKALNKDAARQLYSPTRKASFEAAFATNWDAKAIVAGAYRPLDRRFLYNRQEFVDWPRPKLQQVWGKDNVGLFAMPLGTGTDRRPGVTDCCPTVTRSGAVTAATPFRCTTGGQGMDRTT